MSPMKPSLPPSEASNRYVRTPSVSTSAPPSTPVSPPACDPKTTAPHSPAEHASLCDALKPLATTVEPEPPRAAGVNAKGKQRLYPRQPFDAPAQAEASSSAPFGTSAGNAQAQYQAVVQLKERPKSHSTGIIEVVVSYALPGETEQIYHIAISGEGADAYIGHFNDAELINALGHMIELTQSHPEVRNSHGPLSASLALSPGTQEIYATLINAENVSEKLASEQQVLIGKKTVRFSDELSKKLLELQRLIRRRTALKVNMQRIG